MLKNEEGLGEEEGKQEQPQGGVEVKAAGVVRAGGGARGRIRQGVIRGVRAEGRMSQQSGLGQKEELKQER